MSGSRMRAGMGLLSLAVMVTAAWFPVRALTHDAEGKVRGALAVDLPNSRVSVAGTVLVVTGNTRLEINDAHVSLITLSEYVGAHPGAAAEAEYQITGDQKIAQKVEVEDGPGGGEHEDELELHGALEADVANSTVSVGGVVLAVDANTDLEAGDDHVDLAAFADYLAAHAGSRGEAHYQVVEGVKVATQVETKGSRDDDGDDDDHDEEELTGILTADAAGGTVSVGSVLFQVAAGTEIELSRRHVSLTALAAYLTQNPGTLGKVEYRQLDGQLVAREIKVFGTGSPNPVAEVEVSGVIAALNTRTGSLQLQVNGTQSLTLTLNGATEIQVDAARVTLSELANLLPAGVEVRARLHYHPDTLVVREMDVTIPVAQTQATIVQVNKGSRTLTLQTVTPTAAARKPRVPKVKAQVLKGATIIRGNTIIRINDLRKGQTITISTFDGRRQKVAPEVTVAP